MRIKRSVSFLLAVCMVLSITACNRKDPSPDQDIGTSNTTSATADADLMDTETNPGVDSTTGDGTQLDSTSPSSNGTSSDGDTTDTAATQSKTIAKKPTHSKGDKTTTTGSHPSVTVSTSKTRTTSKTTTGINNTKKNVNLAVWTTHSLDRVRQNRKAQASADFSLYAAKGEYESFQIVANSKKGFITLQDLTISDFKGSSGTISAKDNVTIFREHYVAVEQNSPVRGNKVMPEPTGMIADALIPVRNPETGAKLSNNRFDAFPIEIDPSACQPFWIDVFVPRNAKAGSYTATYTIQSDGGIQTGTVTLTVWDIALPKEQVQKTCFGSWTEKTSMKAREAAKNRIFITGLNADLEKELHDQYGYNMSSVPFWSGADVNNAKMNEPPTVAEVKAAAAQHMPGLPLYCYSADEIGGVPSLFAPLIRWGQVMHKAGVQHLVVMPPVEELFDDGLGTGRSAVDIWVVLPFQYEAHKANIQKARDKGDSIWTYNCLVQDGYSPKWLLDYSLINYRIHPGFINYSQDVDGFLFWTIDNWKSVKDPWISMDVHADGVVWNGDGMLFYPGDDVGLYDSYVPSIRVKAIRDGLEDYELCKAIEAMGKKSVATSCSNAVGASFSQWTQDAKKLLQERIDMGNAV